MTVPASMFKNVVLPAPLGPNKPNTSPRLTFKLILFKALTFVSFFVLLVDFC